MFHSAIGGKTKAVPALHHAPNLQTIIYLQTDTKNIAQTHAYIHSNQAPHALKQDVVIDF